MALATVSLWKDGRRQPSLPGVLRLCRVAGIDIVPFLRGDLEPMAATQLSFEMAYVRPSDERHREIAWDAVRAELEATLPAVEPASLASVLRKVRVDNRQAKRELPELCAAIASRYRRWVTHQAAGRSTEEMQLVRDVIAGLRRDNIYPSRHQVQNRLPRSVRLRRRHLREVWIEEARDPQQRFLKASASLPTRPRVAPPRPWSPRSLRPLPR